MAAMMLAESGVVLGSSTLTSFLSKTSSCRPSHLGSLVIWTEKTLGPLNEICRAMQGSGRLL